MPNNIDETIDNLLYQLEYGKGTMQDIDQWMTVLIQIFPESKSSDEMLEIERRAKTNCRTREIQAEVGDNLTRSQLVELVERGVHAMNDLHDIVEFDAIGKIFTKNVPNPDAYILLWAATKEITVEEAVDQALSYTPDPTKQRKPILL